MHRALDLGRLCLSQNSQALCPRVSESGPCLPSLQAEPGVGVTPLVAVACLVAMTSAIRGLVSKKKKRFQEDGFDLDLTYVTPRLIAMGFPSTGIEGMYRNPMPEVQRFFEQRHKGHYRIYNLCCERAYDLEGFFPSVKRFPFEDHNPCALPVLRLFCEDVDAFLAENAANVVAIHCKAGKGRTGLMVATYMLHSRVKGCTSAEEALRLYAEARTHNAKGVTIPSQRRYVHYYEHEWRFGRRPPRILKLTHVRLCTVPHFDKGTFSVGGGCDPYFRVALQTPIEGDESGLLYTPRTIYDYKKVVNKSIKKFTPNMRFADLDCSSHNLNVHGDVKLTFYDGEELSKDCKMFHLWFNTGYVTGEDGVLSFEKAVVDKANKDKHCKRFDPMFKVQIFFTIVDDSMPTGLATAGGAKAGSGMTASSAAVAVGKMGAELAAHQHALMTRNLRADSSELTQLEEEDSMFKQTTGDTDGDTDDEHEDAF